MNDEFIEKICANCCYAVTATGNFELDYIICIKNYEFDDQIACEIADGELDKHKKVILKYRKPFDTNTCEDFQFPDGFLCDDMIDDMMSTGFTTEEIDSLIKLVEETNNEKLHLDYKTRRKR